MPKSAIATILILMVLLLTPDTARADCATQLETLRAKLHEIKDERRRQEATKLAEKADNDHRNGRERLCSDAVGRAQTLLK